MRMVQYAYPDQGPTREPNSGVCTPCTRRTGWSSVLSNLRKAAIGIRLLGCGTRQQRVRVRGARRTRQCSARSSVCSRAGRKLLGPLARSPRASRRESRYVREGQRSEPLTCAPAIGVVLLAVSRGDRQPCVHDQARAVPHRGGSLATAAAPRIPVSDSGQSKKRGYGCAGCLGACFGDHGFLLGSYALKPVPA
jgi:hypothetical protein